MNRIPILIILALLGAAGVAGSGEREQSTFYKDGKFRGSPIMGSAAFG